MQNTPDIDIDALQKLIDAADGWKWETVQGDQFGHLSEGEFYDIGTVDADQYAVGEECHNKTVLDFIAAFNPQTARALLDRLRKAEAANKWISVDERLPEVGVGVLVYEPPRPEDWPDTVRIFFDHICPDYEDWHDHCESYEHFMAVGGAGAAGPDVVCTGPSQRAPYTHWMPLPAAPDSAPTDSAEKGASRADQA